MVGSRFMRLVLLWVFLLTPSFVVHAASLYIDPAYNTLYRGDTAILSVRLDVDEEAGECVNAVDAVINYTGGIDPVDVSVGDSIFSIWIEKPTINRENKTITFAGGIPNGYCGRVSGDPRLTNTLAKLVFRSPGFTVGGSTDEDPRVTFAQETMAYINDGRGTQASLNTYGTNFTLDSRAGSELKNDWKLAVLADDIPPEKFSISLEKDTYAFSQKYYIVFNALDKQTGIDHYEVMEESIDKISTFQWGRADAPWVMTYSPYVLEDQTLNSVIRVKAVDKAGNEYIANLIPDESMRTTSNDQMIMYGLLIVAGLLLLIIVFLLVRLLMRKLRQTQENEEGNQTYDYEDDEYESE